MRTVDVPRWRKASVMVKITPEKEKLTNGA
jgi:hypothetical protein